MSKIAFIYTWYRVMLPHELSVALAAFDLDLETSFDQHKINLTRLEGNC